MILAAGLGTRLRPLTNTTPKPLLPVAGQPLLVWNLLLLRQYGIQDVMINLHHLGQQIQEYVKDGSTWGLRVTYSQEPVILGTGGGLKQAEPFFEGQPFLVINGDTLVDLNISQLAEQHQAQDALATMVVREDPDAERWGPLELDATHRIWSINHRGGVTATKPPSLVTRMFAGIHILHPSLLQEIPLGQESSIIDAYVRALDAEQPIYGFEISGYWSDVGTSERYCQAELDAQSGRIDLKRRLSV